MAMTEGLVLDGLNLNAESGGAFGLEKIDFTPPAKKPEWAEAADGDGAQLVRAPLFGERTITAVIRVNQQSSMNEALAKIGNLVDLIQEAEKNAGIPLEWTPDSSTKTITFYVLTGMVTGIPILVEGDEAGWFQKSPLITVTFTCKPFGYGPEVVGEAVNNETGLSVAEILVKEVPGDVPAEGRLIVTDTAGVPRRWVEWGIQNRYYSSSTHLILDSEDMVPVAGAQSTTFNSEAYKPSGATKGTIATSLVPEPTICAETGVLAHVGTFRVKARVRAVLGSESAAENVAIRLGWQDGEGPVRRNEWAKSPVGNLFCEVDLGTINITPALIGTQKWVGLIEGMSANHAGADKLHIDYLTFIPVLEGYGKAIAPATEPAAEVVAFDNLTTGTLSGNLNGRTPALGAAWATSGATTDWTVEAGKLKRATMEDTQPRYGVVGSAVGNSRVTGVFNLSKVAFGVTTIGVLARWVESTNYAFFTYNALGAIGDGILKLGIKWLGTTHTISELFIPAPQPRSVTLAITATLDGVLSGKAILEGAPYRLSGSSEALETGNTLASGKGGIIDENVSALASPSRTVLSLSVGVFPAIAYCIQPHEAMVVLHNATLTEDPSGTYWGPPPVYRGSRLYIPQAGSVERSSRLLVKADRNDLEEADQQLIADGFKIQVNYRPRFHVIPR